MENFEICKMTPVYASLHLAATLLLMITLVSSFPGQFSAHALPTYFESHPQNFFAFVNFSVCLKYSLIYQGSMRNTNSDIDSIRT